MNENNQSFLDSKTLVAVILVGFSWLGWQWYMQSKYPKVMKSADPQSVGETPKIYEKPTSTPAPPQAELREQRNSETSVAESPETILEYKGENLSFEISSKGMSLRNFQLNRFMNRSDTVETLVARKGDYSYGTGLIAEGKDVHFQMVSTEPGVFVGKATVDGQAVEKTLRIREKEYVVEVEIKVLGAKDSFRGITTVITEAIPEAVKKSMFLPALDHNEFFAISEGSSQRVNLNVDKGLDNKFTKNSVVSLGSQYFTQALVNKSSILPESDIHLDTESRTATATISYPMLNKGGAFDVKYLAYVGPKSLSLMKSIDTELASVINFGMFSFIAHYLLQLMILFHEWVGNWGITIILLTIVVRALVLPFNVMSYKSMKAMQKIQPLLKEIREKYKDDSAKVSLETMSIMKTHKVNPLGGCLPLLLQFPIFLALYQVLGQSIELYRAPFGLWIHDLSMKDPYYVLPALMGVTLFFQQKITPNTMDPAQKKILMFMPLIFTFFMISLPSGLTLYIFVSGLFGLVQQLYFMHERKDLAAVKS